MPSKKAPNSTPPSFTIGLLGGTSVGKSSLLYRILNDTFLDSDDPTVEDNVYYKTEVDGKSNMVLFVDTGGGFYETMGQKWIKSCSAYVLVYAINSESSFILLNQMLKDIKTLGNDKAPKLIVGNFLDDTTRTVPETSLKSLAESFENCQYTEVSAKTGENIQVLRSFAASVAEPKVLPTIVVPEDTPPKAPKQRSFLGLLHKKKESTDLRVSSEPDTWSTRNDCPKEWSQVEANDAEVDSTFLSMFDTSCRSEGFHFEFGREEKAPESVQIDNPEKDMTFYTNYFHDREHKNYWGESEKLGNVIITIEMNDSGACRAIIRTKKTDIRMMIPEEKCSKSKDMLKYIQSKQPGFEDIKFKRIDTSPQMEQLLQDFEKKQINLKYKFGVLYVRDGQQDENEIYSNTERSDDFEEFLNFIGDRVAVNGFSGYAAGLDTRFNTTGTHSVYTKFNEFEIMYHVAPLLPYQEFDEQRVERKRHLGNDVSLLIFKEGNTPFNPKWIRSHFNHVFVIVQVHEKTADKTTYKISVATKGGVESYSPYLPKNPIFEKNEQFRNFLLTKLINSERASMNGGEFKSTLLRTRNDLISEVSRKLAFRKKYEKGRRGSSNLNSSFGKLMVDAPRGST